MRVHALVDNIHAGQRAVLAGATVIQLRAKLPTKELVALGAGFRALPALFIVNDDVDAALELGADGVHLGQDDKGAAKAREFGLILGRSASSLREATSTDADYLGVGPVWPTTSKLDAANPMGLAELARICQAVAIPVIAIGGVTARNAASCIQAGAYGVATIRAATDPALRSAVDLAVAHR